MASPLANVKAKDCLSSTLPNVRKDIAHQSISIPDQTKSRKLQELIENQTKQLKLPSLKPANQLFPVEEDKEETKTPLCSLAMKKRKSLLKASTFNSRALCCSFSFAP
eukprot:TRINITY_DN12192_c0_g2_i11.p2 TRINITY_DN12192_c0_g2~~TRINITY_DN12192_c0_g2_i11.p2  ORF type:complete len:108 (+),score=15.83 TRINITY_DN12192_c0_g2_i11:562-885(+)